MKEKSSVYSVYDESPSYAFLKSFFVPSLRPAFCISVPSIFYNFFFRQYRAAVLPGRIPVNAVDHPLDEKIPFVPSWVTIYLDFIGFWVRMLSFLLRRYRRRAYAPVKDFILSIGKLYAYAADVYKKNLSTTKRPFYIARPRFFLIHLTDPHLMCIPSLHVMVVIRTYTGFAVIAKSLGESEELKEQVLEMKYGALAISRAILFVKQHSVNCIAASLYAMTCFDAVLFPPKEADAFTGLLFTPAPSFGGSHGGNHPSAAPNMLLPEADQAAIKSHILGLYRRFLSEREPAKSWDEPLVNFMRSHPRVR
jgi:hypothetical protein